MQVIENKADVSGEITKVEPHPSLPGMMSVGVQIDSVTPVAGYANLLGSTPGQAVDISMPEDIVRQAAMMPGKAVKLRAQLRGPGQIFSFENA